ncbi:divalent-cation tolerance protein CutA [Sphingomonas sp. Sph1(2015)]|jgi:periplasmic divalent cation tolerance protein|uniref:divalent-cation tolerance protein CutA n=1 Tax=Sphingomonas TaxID=13687 RepID=UPI000977FCAD|nr:divalent-cation tolerance protein CutA [Sphingomonas sp. Sph1(2015)]OMJ33548.1 divalent-cation tolerance protein CutA [Sphingomonas sp. Sph1(2015)]
MIGEAIVVMCAVGSRDEAAGIARALVEQRLAACVQMMPVESWYRWDGAVQHEPEVMLHIKTIRSRFARLCEAIEALHSYDVPEIVALPITEASPRYLEWVRQSVC